MLLRPPAADHASRFSLATPSIAPPPSASERRRVRARSHRFPVPFFGVFALPSARRPSLQKLAKARVTERRAGQNK